MRCKMLYYSIAIYEYENGNCCVLWLLSVPIIWSKESVVFSTSEYRQDKYRKEDRMKKNEEEKSVEEK